MKQFHFIFLFIFSIIGRSGIVVNLNAAASDLKMYVFSVGQGNFILLKKDDRFLAVDVGCGAQGGKPLKRYKSGISKNGKLNRKLNDIVSSSTEKDLFLLVTHNHWDHFCLFKYLKGFFNQIWVPGWIQGLADTFYSFVQRSSIVDDVPLDYLGEDIFISYLLPHPNAEKAHEKNLIVFVKYRTVLFLLPGDADGDYLNLNAGVFMDELRRQSNECSHCCIVLPHHGSNSNGTLALTLAAHRVLQENGCRETIFIISSNPNENDLLPRSAVFPLLPNAPPAVLHWYWDFSEKLITVSESSVASSRTIIKDNKNNLIGYLNTQRIPSPVFITGAATGGTGYLVTTNGNNLILYNGITSRGDRLLYPVQ